MRKKRQFKAGRCYHMVSRIAHQAFFFDEEEKNRFVELLMGAREGLTPVNMSQ